MQNSENGEQTGPMPLRRFGLSAVLVSAMVASSYQLFVLGVLASRFIDDFALSRFELGIIGSVNTAVGAVTAPITGRLTDRIGPKNSVAALQFITVAGFGIMAGAHSTSWLIVSAIVLGVPQGWGNPATNALIAERVAVGSRGTITGIKQSGVQLGIFLAGATLPALDAAFGWRAAMVLYAVVFALTAVFTAALPTTERPQAVGDRADDPGPLQLQGTLRRGIHLVALYALLMGTASGAVSRFLALFAEEDLGWSTGSAGIVLSLTGLVGIGVRIVAAQVAETRIAPMKMLAWLAGVAIATSALLWATPIVGSWLLWPTAVLFPVGFSAWNAVAMLAVIMAVPTALSGRASGIVLFGFLGGLAIGGPLAGILIDGSGGSYSLVWLGSALLSALAVITARTAQSQLR